MKKITYAFALSQEILNNIKIEAQKRGVSQSSLVEEILFCGLEIKSENYKANEQKSVIKSQLTDLGAVIRSESFKNLTATKKLDLKNFPSLTVKLKFNTGDFFNTLLRLEVKTKRQLLSQWLKGYFDKLAVCISAMGLSFAQGESFVEIEFPLNYSSEEIADLIKNFVEGLNESGY